MINTYKEQAERLGVEAFKEGRKAIPAHDKRLWVLIQGLSRAGQSVLPVLNAWLAGWHGANLNAEVS